MDYQTHKCTVFIQDVVLRSTKSQTIQVDKEDNKETDIKQPNDNMRDW